MEHRKRVIPVRLVTARDAYPLNSRFEVVRRRACSQCDCCLRRSFWCLLLHARLCRRRASTRKKPARIIVPFPLDQATDISARWLAEELSKLWARKVTIDNRGVGPGIPGALAGCIARSERGGRFRAGRDREVGRNFAQRKWQGGVNIDELQYTLFRAGFSIKRVFLGSSFAVQAVAISVTR